MKYRLAAAALAAILLTSAAAHAEPLKIRQGWVALTSVLSPVVFEKKDILRHYGQSYVLESTHFSGTSPQLTALAAGEIDIVTIGYSTLAAAVLNAKMDDIRVVADGFQDGVDGYYSTTFVVRNDSGIKTVDDLKGKVLASNAIGGALDLALRVMLRQHQLEDKRDVTIIETDFGNLAAVLLDRKADLIGIVPPFSINPRLEQGTHVLFTMRDAMGGPSQEIMLAARTPFLEKNRAALDDFFEDMLIGMHWFLDTAHRTEVMQIVARAMKQQPERFAGFLYSKKDFYRDPDGRPNLTALQHDIETQLQLGFIKTSFDVRKYTDQSFITRAAERLK